MPPTHRIAVIQLHPKPLNPEHNFASATRYLRAAASQGAHLAVLPEYHLTNWKPEDPAFASHCASWQKYLSGYQALAKELDMCIVPGSIVQTIDEDRHPDTVYRQASSGDQARAREEDGAVGLENICYFIDNRGEIAGRYVKKNLWGPVERDHLASSGPEPHVAFDTPLGKVGLLLCWDLAFPEAFRELISQDAKIIILPAFWTLNDCSKAGLAYNPTAEILFLDSMVTARAFENTCAVVFCNAGGPPGKGYAGVSQVTAPFVGPLTRLGSGGEGMAVVDLDMKIVDIAEENYQVRADLGREGWHYEYRSTKL